MLYPRLSLGFLALSAHLLLFASAYTINVGPATSTLLTPGQTLTYTITLESGDTVVLVDILFVNGNLGNTTNIALNSDLSKAADRTGDYLIPSVPPGKLYSVRLVNASTKELLKDSTTFEVFAPGSTSITSDASTLPPTSLSTASKTSTSGSSPTGSTNQNINTESSKSTPVGAIVGGVIGGIVVLAALLCAFLFNKRRRNASKSLPDDADDDKTQVIRHIPTLPPLESPKEPQIEVAVTPFPAGLPTSNASSMFSKGNNAYDIVPTSSDLLSDTTPRSASSGDDFSATYGSLTQSSTDTRTETLRRERERISREIADLETRSRTVGAVGSSTSGSSYAASSFMPPSTAQPGNSDLREQIAMLQEQIRQIEARQMHGTAEPPPEYDGPPPATGSGGGVVSAPSSSALLGDVKDPVA